MLVIEKKSLKEKRQFPLTLDSKVYDRVRNYSFQNNLSMNYIINNMIQYSLSTYIDKDIDKLKLLDFIEELKNNSKISKTNKVNIDYVIVRLRNMFE